VVCYWQARRSSVFGVRDKPSWPGIAGRKDGVASLAYVPAIHVYAAKQDVDARHKAAHDESL